MQSSDMLAAVAPVVDALERLGVAYYLGGSVVSSAYGLARSTLDVDLVADLAHEHVLDKAYLTQWAGDLAIADLLEKAWGESETWVQKKLLFCCVELAPEDHELPCLTIGSPNARAVSTPPGFARCSSWGRS